MDERLEVLRSRFLEHVDLSDPGGCWQWQRPPLVSGYGQFYLGIDGVWSTTAHRAAFILFAYDPGDLVVDHLCRNRLCVNPDHLEPVTRGENVLRGIGTSASNARKTKCKYGHLLKGSNLYVRPDGRGRDCKQCQRDRERTRQLRKETIHA